jgi:tetraacyldisaccharide 4'-kinase
VSLGEQAKTGHGRLPAHEYGDEPALIAAATGVPIAVHPRRALALQALERDYPATDLVIADDGLQHLALARDLEVLVQDARGIGNGRLLPAGPLREPATRLQSVDFVITNVQAGYDDPAPAMTQAHQISMRLMPVQVQHLTTGLMTEWEGWIAAHGGNPVSAVAAIGQPERFFAMLRHSGLVLADAIALPDHDAYEQSPFEPLANTPILITAKDAVKCARFNDPRLWAVHVAPEFSDSTWIERAHEMLVAIAARKASMASAMDTH